MKHRQGYPRLMIAWARLQHQKSDIADTGQGFGFQIVELDELPDIALRPNDDVVLLLCCRWESSRSEWQSDTNW
jgi:hypothetical protein